MATRRWQLTGRTGVWAIALMALGAVGVVVLAKREPSGSAWRAEGPSEIARPSLPPTETDAAVTILWRNAGPSRPPPRDEEHGGADEAPVIILSQIAVSPTELLIDLVYWAEGTVDPTETVASADVRLMADGCPAKAPAVRGVVHLKDQPVDRLSVSRASLPEGELDLRVEAKGARSTIYLIRENGILRYSSREAKKGYIPENPKDKEPTAVVPIRTCGAPS